jgi:hypothetical protein
MSNAIQKYLVESVRGLPYSAALGSSDTSRATTAAKFTVLDGLTANECILPSTSIIFTAPLISASEIKTPFAYGASSMVLSSFPSNAERVTEHLFPSTTSVIMGVEDGITGFVTGDASSATYGMSWGSLTNSTTASLPKGTVIGNDNFNTPANITLGAYYGTGGDGNSELSRLLFKRDAGASDTHGAKNVQRPISEWPNGPDGADTEAGYGSTATVAAVLAQLSISSTVTIGPNDDDGSTMKFWVKKHTAWPGDFIIMDVESGEYLRGIDLKGIVDLETQLFHEDYYFDTAKWKIMDNMVLTNAVGSAVTIVPGMKTAAPVTMAAGWVNDSTGGVTAVNLITAEIAAGTMDLYLPTNTDGASGSDDSLGANISLTGGTDGSDRAVTPVSLPIVIPAGTQIPGSYTVKALTTLPSGFTFPSGTSISGVNVTNLRVQQRISFNKIIMGDGFSIESNMILGEVVTSAKQLEIPLDSRLLGPVTVPVSASWTSDLPVGSVIVGDSYTTQGDITLKEDLIVRSAMTLAKGSKLALRSILPASASTDEDMTFKDQIEFSSQTAITSDFDLRVPITVDALVPTGSGYTLSTGTVIRAKSADGEQTTVLPADMILSNGSTTPGPVRLNHSDQITLLEGNELKGGVVVGPSFSFPATTQFEPGTEFGVGSTLGVGTLLPSGTSILKDSKFTFEFPLPAGFVLPKATKLYSGMRFAAGSNLPATSCRAHEDATLAASAQPFRIVTYGSSQYIVYPSGTVFGNGFTITKNSVLLATAGMAAVDASTAVLATAAYTGGALVTTPVGSAAASYTFDEGEVRFGPGGTGLSLQSFVLNAGVPTSTAVQLRGEGVFANDLMVPLIDNGLIFENVRFNVDFALSKDITIDSDFTVNGDSLAYWPVNHEIPQNLTLAGEVQVTTETIITRKIVLPAAATYYFENILSTSGSFIKVPNIETKLKHNVRVGSTPIVVGQGAAESRSYMILPKGMYVLAQYTEGIATVSGLKLRSQVMLDEDWTLLQDLDTSSSFVAQGVFLPSGALLPGVVTLAADSSFPSGLSLPSAAQLATSFTVGNLVSSTYSLPTLSSLAAGSVIKKGSVITSGFKLSNVVLGPNPFNASSGMYLLHNEKISVDVFYNYFHGTTPVNTVQDFAARLTEMEMLMAILQDQVSNN